ncbi:hypothetical protein B0H13DRAFT_2560895 [Mycena leptocephala]|nr:hypothetical protein B0H13DRAFT_2560895 [Mycena leptocephala]
MPSQSTVTEIRLNNIRTCLTTTAGTLKILADSNKSPILVAISNTTQSLIKCTQTVKQNKNDCTRLMEQTHQLLNAIILVHIKSDEGGELPPSVLNQIGKFTETLHKVHTFVEVQQNGSKIKKFFRQGEMSTLLKDCQAGLRQGLDYFHSQNSKNIFICAIFERHQYTVTSNNTKTRKEHIQGHIHLLLVKQHEWHKQARNTANIREAFTTQSGVNVSVATPTMRSSHRRQAVFTLSPPILQVETRGKGRGRAGTSVDQMELVVNLNAAGADALRWGYFTNYWGLDGLRMIWSPGDLV